MSNDEMFYDADHILNSLIDETRDIFKLYEVSIQPVSHQTLAEKLTNKISSLCVELSDINILEWLRDNAQNQEIPLSKRIEISSALSGRVYGCVDFEHVENLMKEFCGYPAPIPEDIDTTYTFHHYVAQCHERFESRLIR